MIKSLQIPALAIGLIIALATTIYCYSELQKTLGALDQSELARGAQQAQLNEFYLLESADSLARTGQYEAAMEQYAALRSSLPGEGFGGKLGQRINHVRTVIALRDTAAQSANPRFVVREASPLLPPTSPPAPLARTVAWAEQPRKVDSLTLALRQAQLQMGVLRQRAAANETREYLTFKSSEGNEIHYVGEVAEGKANGSGVALLSTGSRYIGAWLDNEKHGEGKFYWSDGASYVGHFEFGQRSGFGTYYFPDGGKFVGEWAGGLRNGEGTFFNKKGKVVAKGIWQDDELAKQL